MFIARSAKRDDIQRLVALADRTFRRPGQTSMGTAYAQLFAESNADHLLMIEEEGAAATLVGLLPARLSIAGCSVPVFSMGSVCTDPAYRGRNYADLLVKRSIVQCTEEGACLLLISGTRGLYARNDCLEVGKTRMYTVQSAEQLSGLAPAEAAVRPFDEERDLPAMLRLMEQDAAYYKRTEEELRQLIRSAAVLSNDSAGQHVWLSYSGDGEPNGYIVFGVVEKKGESFTRVVEYAGGHEAVISLLVRVLREFNLQPLRLTVMPDRAELSESLAAAGCSFTEMTIPGTIRMLNFGKLWDCLQSYRVRQLGAESASLLRLTEEGDCFRIAYKGETVAIGYREATELLFNGPVWLEAGALKDCLSELFPLPFPDTENLNFV